MPQKLPKYNPIQVDTLYHLDTHFSTNPSPAIAKAKAGTYPSPAEAIAKEGTYPSPAEAIAKEGTFQLINLSTNQPFNLSRKIAHSTPKCAMIWR